MVWTGLIIGLLAALVACYGDLKWPKAAKGFGAFLRANRLPAISALLATAGFTVAGLTVIAERRDAAGDAERLRRDNDELKTMALIGRTVQPVIDVVLETGTPLPSGESLKEEAAWNDSGRRGELPRPLGFIPSSARSFLFPGAEPDSVMGILGTFDVRTARGNIRLAFHALKDGTTVATTTPLHIESLRTKIYEEEIPAISFRFTVKTTLNAIDMYKAVMAAYDNGSRPLAITANLPAKARTACVAQADEPRRGRLTFFLDDDRQIAVTAPLAEAPRDCAKSPGAWKWVFAETPKLGLTHANAT